VPDNGRVLISASPGWVAAKIPARLFCGRRREGIAVSMVSRSRPGMALGQSSSDSEHPHASFSVLYYPSGLLDCAKLAMLTNIVSAL
jgi:hypothetical protein